MEDPLRDLRRGRNRPIKAQLVTDDDDDDEAYIYLLWRDAAPFALRAPAMAHNAGKQKRAIIIISTYCVFHVKSGKQIMYIPTYYV